MKKEMKDLMKNMLVSGSTVIFGALVILLVSKGVTNPNAVKENDKIMYDVCQRPIILDSEYDYEYQYKSGCEMYDVFESWAPILFLEYKGYHKNFNKYFPDGDDLDYALVESYNSRRYCQPLCGSYDCHWYNVRFETRVDSDGDYYLVRNKDAFLKCEYYNYKLIYRAHNDRPFEYHDKILYPNLNWAAEKPGRWCKPAKYFPELLYECGTKAETKAAEPQKEDNSKPVVSVKGAENKKLAMLNSMLNIKNY